MDSLTQLVLGAAVGELVLGKKIGNRAPIWGAIGGTIPDLDVIGNLFMDPMGALEFHRGFTHSIVFAFLAPVLFGGLVYKLYHTERHKSWPYKILVTVLNVAMLLSLTLGLNFIFSQDDHPRWWLLIVTVTAAVYLGFRLYKYYLRKNLESLQTRYFEWYLLFFLAFITHILLDCFTAYGTQAFLPFSNYRVAFDNIAVADPFFTIPFLICTIIFATLRRNTKARTLINYIGIGYSLLYMLWTFKNKVHVNQVFEKALAHREISADRCRTGPTILNNFLWTCVAEDKDRFYVGQYSLFDSNPNLHHLNEIPKNDSIHQALLPLKDYQTIRWFANNYVAAYPTDSMLILADLRYGGMFDTIKGPQDLIFKFEVRDVNGKLEFTDSRERPVQDIGELIGKYIERIKGY